MRDVGTQRLAERLLGVGQLDAVLRALRAGDGRDDRRQVQLQRLGVDGLAGRVVPEALLLGVGLDERDLLLGPAGQAQVVDGLAVDREDADRGAELRRHVADRGAVRQRHGADALAVELDELADDALLAQHFGDRQHEVGGGGAGGQLTGELEADDARDQHGDRLAEHRGLGLDATDAPSQHADAVDHRGVRVGADQRVRVRLAVADHDDAREVLDVDLVHDAGAGRDDLELVERGLAPAQELVALAVALVLQVDVQLERVRAAEDVGDDRVVDHELGGGERVHLLGVATQLGDGFTHGGEVDYARHTGEVLHHDAGGRELDLGVGFGVRVPGGERAHVVGGDVRAVLGPQQVLQQDLQAERQTLCALHGAQPEHLVGGVADVERAAGAEAVLTSHVQLHLVTARWSVRGTGRSLPQAVGRCPSTPNSTRVLLDGSTQVALSHLSVLHADPPAPGELVKIHALG